MPSLKQHYVKLGDCLDVLKDYPDDFFDLVFTSPPYEDARTYGIDFTYKDDDWVNWALARYLECNRVCKGLVAWIVEGRTRQFEWSATPMRLLYEAREQGVKFRKPPVFYRVGIPGSGSVDWLRNDYEFILCSSKGKLPWSDNVAMGHEPKYAPGGPMSNRTQDGDRVVNDDGYTPPKKANPGNVIKCKVGGGLMGSALAHENEAPFSESIVEFFVRSFCPVGGIVLDPFCGSGTVAAVCEQLDRRSVNIEIRKEQVILTQTRIEEARDDLQLSRNS